MIEDIKRINAKKSMSEEPLTWDKIGTDGGGLMILILILLSDMSPI
nr:hypothetical protein [uncultured Glaciecola sp.]